MRAPNIIVPTGAMFSIRVHNFSEADINFRRKFIFLAAKIYRYDKLLYRIWCLIKWIKFYHVLSNFRLLVRHFIDSKTPTFRIYLAMKHLPTQIRFIFENHCGLWCYKAFQNSPQKMICSNSSWSHEKTFIILGSTIRIVRYLHFNRIWQMPRKYPVYRSTESATVTTK